MNIIAISSRQKVDGLSPYLYPAALVEKPCYFQCGDCGFSGTVEFYVHSDGSDPLQPVCDCPLPAVLSA